MRATIAKIVGSAIALVALGSICVIGLRAQQTGGNARSAAVTTHWVGCLVAGQSDTLDRITPGPSPAIVRQVELGLRSDGVAVWREATRH
jgi:hypothetical protein